MALPVSSCETRIEAVEAVRRIGTLDRDRIRAEFDRRFTAQHMAQNYLKLYSRLSKGEKDGRCARRRLAIPGSIAGLWSRAIRR